MLGEIVTEVSAARFPINEKLTLPGVVLDTIGRQEDDYVLAFHARTGISCARYLYSVIESTLSPWDSRSWIELTPSP